MARHAVCTIFSSSEAMAANEKAVFVSEDEAFFILEEVPSPKSQAAIEAESTLSFSIQ